MGRRSAPAFLSIGVLGLIFPGLDHQAPQTFRTRTDLVIVDVAVLNGGTPVAGLTASDFQLLDNGTPQTVEIIASEALPLDIFLVVETGGSIAESNPTRFWDDVQTLAGQLRPGDRLALTTFGTAAFEEVPLQPIPATISAKPVARGTAVLYDALLQALVRPGTSGRRHLVVLMTYGVDVMSVSSPKQVLDIAKRSDALLFIVLNRARFGVNPLLDEIAYATGGDVLKESNLPEAFRKILVSLQKGYTLGYVPRGVPATGWHEIMVKVNRPGAYTVRARRGYFAGS